MATLFCPVAVAGSGKSMLAGRWVDEGRMDGGAIVSLDKLRHQMTGDIADQSANQAIVGLAHTIVSSRLSRGLTTFMDSTHLSDQARSWSAGLAEEYGVSLVWLYFDIDPVVAIQRNRERDRVVPEYVMAKQIQSFLQVDPHALPGSVMSVNARGRVGPLADSKNLVSTINYEDK